MKMILIALCMGAMVGGSSLPPIASSTGEVASKYCPQERPFSWYYPYEYQYYYPKKRDSCYWQYSNGAYFYTRN